MNERQRRGASALAVHLPRDRRDEAFLVSFCHPRTTAVLPLGAAAPEAIAIAIASAARRDATLVFDSLEAGESRADAAPVLEPLSRMVPGVEARVVDPAEVHHFLWYYRDRHDPMTLGHASERALTDFIRGRNVPPAYRGHRKREDDRRGLLEARDLLLTMGNALGVRPPIPAPDGSPGWSAKRIAGLTDAVLALLAGLLERWGSPLARLAFPPEEPPRLTLSDPSS